jgi:hypothetical protein
VSAGTGTSSSEERLAPAAMSRSSSAPAAVAARRHAATAGHTGRCGSGSLPSLPAGRCGAPAVARSFPWHPVRPRARRRRSDALPRPRARGLQSRRGWNAEEPRPDVLLRESEPERRMLVRGEGEGASAGCPGWELVAASRGSAPPPNGSPPRSRLLRLAREREAGGWEGRRQLAAHCRPHIPPASRSSLLLLDVHGKGQPWTRADYPGGRVASKSRARRATHAQPDAHFAMGNPHE